MVEPPQAPPGPVRHEARLSVPAYALEGRPCYTEKNGDPEGAAKFREETSCDAKASRAHS
jgi:hypothetical protein